MAQKRSKSLSPRGQFWRKHVQQWQKSGTTQVQYCRDHGLSVAAFRWWRQKLGRSHRVRASQKGVPTEPGATFTEIRIPEGDLAAAAYAYEIILPNRTHLRLRQHFDPEAVATLVSVLGAPC